MDKKYENEYAKDNLVYYKKTLENSVKMYEKTIKEMTERKSSQESLSFVIQMKRDTEGQIREIDEALENLEKNNKTEFIIAYNELTEKLKTFNPFMRNRFIVDFENDDIKDFFVESVNYSRDRLCIRFRNCEGFFAPEYFEKNRSFENVRLFLLNPIGEKRAMITFYDLTVEDFITDELDYKNDSLLGTEVIFSFKKVIHSNNANKIEKDPQ